MPRAKKTETKVLTGSQIVIECLKEQGVDTVFGYPGGSILNIYDELYKHSDEINHILTSHEQGAAHAADGYARATGKVGVCMATSGPGATNLVTGIATAYMDSVPLVAITANVTLPWLGKDTFQEVDIAGITMPITKHGFIVKDVTTLADILRRAFAIAKSGRPGPVLVDITKDVTANVADFEASEKVVDEIISDFGEAHILVNNAGIVRDTLILSMKESDFDAVINVNLKGTFNMTKAVYKHFMKKRRGRIINISSIVGLTGNAGQANYASAKAGIIGLTKSVAKELGSRNVTANAIAPGFIKTDMTDAMPEKAREATLAAIPLKRPGTVEDIANTAAFLASDEASYITGEVIRVDGGIAI